MTEILKKINQLPMNKRRRTKLITTIGPVSSNYEVLDKFVRNGVSTVRLNFSHGSDAKRIEIIETIKELQRKTKLAVSVMLDTKGPEIRIGQMKDGMQLVEKNTLLTLICGQEAFKNHIGDSSEISISYDMHKDLKVGNEVLIDDGKLTTVVEKIDNNKIQVRTINDHLLKTNKRVNIPGVDFSLPFMSAQDERDIRFGLDHNIDYIAASFVNTASNIKSIRKILKEKNAEHVQIIAKIESILGIKNIESIIDEADGIMVARGDLGLEIPYQDVPFWQKFIIRSCRDRGKPVIVATQMLDSMETSPHPTRAEVTDVYYAIELGSDCIMLSGESASGKFPLEAVETMRTIALRAEQEFYNKLYYPLSLDKIANHVPNDARSQLAKKIAYKLQDGDFRFAIVLSKTGKLLKAISRFRPNSVILGLCLDAKHYTSFGIWANVFMVQEGHKIFEKVMDNYDQSHRVVELYGARPGDKFLIIRNDNFEERIF